MHWLDRIMPTAIAKKFWRTIIHEFLVYFVCFIHVSILPVYCDFARRAANCCWRQNCVDQFFTERTGNTRHARWVIRRYPVMINIAQPVTIGFLMRIFVFCKR